MLGWKATPLLTSPLPPAAAATTMAATFCSSSVLLPQPLSSLRNKKTFPPPLSSADTNFPPCLSFLPSFISRIFLPFLDATQTLFFLDEGGRPCQNNNVLSPTFLTQKSPFFPLTWASQSNSVGSRGLLWHLLLLLLRRGKGAFSPSAGIFVGFKKRVHFGFPVPGTNRKENNKNNRASWEHTNFLWHANFSGFSLPHDGFPFPSPKRIRAIFLFPPNPSFPPSEEFFFLVLRRGGYGMAWYGRTDRGQAPPPRVYDGGREGGKVKVMCAVLCWGVCITSLFPSSSSSFVVTCHPPSLTSLQFPQKTIRKTPN